MEGENPTRRYKDFRTRQAFRGLIVVPVPVANATAYLLNNTTGAQLLVVRDIEINGTASDVAQTKYLSGAQGANPGVVQPLFSSMPTQVGILTRADAASFGQGDFQINFSTTGSYAWQREFPFAVLEPNVTLAIQDTTIAHAMQVSFVWEAIEPDEIEFYY